MISKHQDYDNKWSDPRCPGDNCHRSHIIMLETMNCLSMITNAEVASNEVVAGVASYGRFTAGSIGAPASRTSILGKNQALEVSARRQLVILVADIKSILSGNHTASASFDKGTMRKNFGIRFSLVGGLHG
jgi:hypothetical protein